MEDGFVFIWGLLGLDLGEVLINFILGGLLKKIELINVYNIWNLLN